MKYKFFLFFFKYLIGRKTVRHKDNSTALYPQSTAWNGLR